MNSTETIASPTGPLLLSRNAYIGGILDVYRVTETGRKIKLGFLVCATPDTSTVHGLSGTELQALTRYLCEVRAMQALKDAASMVTREAAYLTGGAVMDRDAAQVLHQAVELLQMMLESDALATPLFVDSRGAVSGAFQPFSWRHFSESLTRREEKTSVF